MGRRLGRMVHSQGRSSWARLPAKKIPDELPVAPQVQLGGEPEHVLPDLPLPVHGRQETSGHHQGIRVEGSEGAVVQADDLLALRVLRWHQAFTRGYGSMTLWSNAYFCVFKRDKGP